MSVTDLPQSASVVALELQQILHQAHVRHKSPSSVDPQLSALELARIVAHLRENLFGQPPLHESQVGSARSYHSSFEAAARNVLYEELASSAIQEHGYDDLWKLLDVVQACADEDLCEGGLPLWLVEELLDTQTIEGCRVIFDYLESRRERMAGPNGPTLNKRNTLLRTCNELLHRLSRAEDAVFCGRVFTYLFQMFPLGDKSAINLRGEYHVENVTIYDKTRVTVEELGAADVKGEAMDIDNEAKAESTVGTASEAKAVDAHDEPIQAETKNEAQGKDTLTAESMPVVPSLVTDTSEQAAKLSKETSNADDEDFYSRFWSLQNILSNPPAIFDNDRLAGFREDLEEVVRKFKQNPTIQQMSGNVSRGTKRSRNVDEQEFASAFNPKYLTSRELFQLELGDLTFQRHILVQALIMIDFMLSLTTKAKKKLGSLKVQKAMDYSFVLSEEDTQWATTMRGTIMAYLAVPPDGRFYNRMVENVLSRDKNWLRWKMEACPLIEKSPLATEDYTKARADVKRVCTSRRLKATPMGALRLDFLTELERTDKLALLRKREPVGPGALTGLLNEVKNADLDLEMADKAEKPAEWLRIVDRRASKSWRALRLASKDRLDRFADVHEGESLDALVGVRRVAIDATEALAEVRPEVVNGSTIDLPSEDGKPVEGKSDNAKKDGAVVVDGLSKDEARTSNGKMDIEHGAGTVATQQTS